MSSASDAKIRRFKFRVADWARKLHAEPAQVRVQAMSRKWASCSPARWVSFSTDLLAQPKSFQDYVIVHELLHLKVPNHGKLFHSLLRTHLSGLRPHFPRERRNQLYVPGV